MTHEEIRLMQVRINLAGFPLEADGWWGPKSQAQCRNYLRSMMPSPNPWPRSDMASLSAFYGRSGDEGNLVTLAFPYPMFYDGRRVFSTRVHKRCKDSLLRVLETIGRSYGQVRGIMEEAEDYGGVFNDRNKRGSSRKSVHSWGAAIDLDADDNSFRDSWPMVADMPLQIMEAFAREGWTSGGAFWGYDAMHFEAVRPNS